MVAAAKALAPHLAQRKLRAMCALTLFDKAPEEGDGFVEATAILLNVDMESLLGILPRLTSKVNHALRRIGAPVSYNLVINHHESGDKQTLIDGAEQALEDNGDNP